MKRLCLSKLTSAIGLATAVFTLVLGHPDNSGAQPFPPMTIKIYNNDPNYNIYPVLTTGTSRSSLWLRALFKIKDADAKDKPYPKLHNFRLYQSD